MKLFELISEDINIDEGGPVRTDKEWLDEIIPKYPNWDYSNAIVYHDGVRKKIKNVYCKIHNHSFPGKNDPSINVNDHLNKGYGCRDCAKESQAKKVSEKLTKTEEQWKKELSNIKHLKNKCDFSKSKISNSTGKPLVSHIYCKIHKNYFNGGSDDKGISVYGIPNLKNLCPKCSYENPGGRSIKYFEDWIDIFKSNPINKNYNYSKSEVYYVYNDYNQSKTILYNVYCKVKGLNGKQHGLFAKDGVLAVGHSNGQGQCPKCVCESKQKKFIKDSIEIHGNKYLYDKVDFCDDSTIIRKQGLNRITSHRKVLIGCKKPNHDYFFQYTSAHKNGSGCPICKESKGEMYIAELLTRLKIKFVREKKFNETGAMEFDFYLPKLNTLIEYDGEGHFWPVFGSSEYSRNFNYNSTFERDNLKNKFVKTNQYGIKLIRIPYTIEFNKIDSELFKAIKNTPTNQITYIGDYPRRHNRKEVESKFKVDLSQPIQKPRRMTESKLSFENILKGILLENDKPTIHPKNKVLIQKAEFAYTKLKNGTYLFQDDVRQRTAILWELPDEVEFGFVHDPENGNTPKITLNSDIKGTIVYTIYNDDRTIKKISETNLLKIPILGDATHFPYKYTCMHIKKLMGRLGRTHINFNGYSPEWDR